LTPIPVPGTHPGRRDLRRSLLAERERFAASPSAGAARTALSQHLRHVLGEFEPTVLGVYWAMRHEFNAVDALLADPVSSNFAAAASMALPYAQRSPVQMHYRRWDGRPPQGVDECGIRSADGPLVVPDVVLVPCVGFTETGFRLGYGGGYFDRWLAAHPGVTSVGLAWSGARIDEHQFQVQPHDQRLSLVITEHGVV